MANVRSVFHALRRMTGCVIFLATAVVAMAEVSVSSRLSHRAAPVGSAVILEVVIKDAERDTQPPRIDVDGLEIQYAGPSHSQQVQVINGQMSRQITTIHSYRVVPQREGQFTIPALEIAVDGRRYQTQPVGLKVTKGSSQSANQQPGESDAIGFAELEIPKKRMYVGETIAAEFRLFVRSGIRAEIGKAPDLTGDGFTIQKMPEPDQQQENRDGVDYTVVTFRTAITPSKAGKLSVGPTEIPFVAQVPRARRNRGNSLVDSLLGDDFFDPFGGGFAERRRFDAKAPAVEIEVLPVPSEGRPKEFTGAVGQFTFEGEGSPSRVKLGDPVTMRLKVSGKGNFDRVSAPVLANPDGWQTYDASENFAPQDELKTSGTKTFEMPVVPQGRQERMPEFVFAYFDPASEKYVALRTKPQSLTVEGAPVTPPPPVATLAPAPAEPEKAPDQSSVKLRGLSYEYGPIGSFAPIYARRPFWLMHGALGAIALALLASRFFRTDPAKARSSSLSRERAELWRRLRNESGVRFYDDAVRLLQLDTALISGVEPGSVDAADVARTRNLDAEVARGVEEIFDARGALLFAGSANTAAEVKADERARVLHTLEVVSRK